MKKAVLLIVLFFGFCQKNIAQTTIFSEDFQELTNLSAMGWWQYNDTNTPFGSYQATFLNEAWGIIEWAAESPNYVASSTSWFTGTTPAPADRWMITPIIDLTGYLGAPVSLSFNARAHDVPPYADNFDLKISTTDYEKTSFTNLYTSTSNPNVLISQTTPTVVDLSNYGGEMIYLAWVNNYTNGNLVSIDNIEVTGTTLSTNSFSSEAILVSPNPVSDVLSISNVKNIKLSSYALIDNNGRIIKENSLNVDSNFTIDVSDLSNGIYFLKLVSENETLTKKIIKN